VNTTQLLLALCLFIQTPSSLTSQSQVSSTPGGNSAGSVMDASGRTNYVLGPDDEITMMALDAEEISNKQFRIDNSGNINVPMLGKIHAGGLTIEQLESEVRKQLGKYLQQPQVTISVAAFRSQPVSVIGAVNSPGTIQIEGRKNLVEVIAKAGGLRGDAGNNIKITRKVEWGKIPLPNATMDSSNAFSVAEVSYRAIVDAVNPEQNIAVFPNDVISVPRAKIFYVIGEVRRAGGFTLIDRDRVSVLQALAMAEGLASTAAAQDAKVIRANPGADRVEIALNLKKIMAGKEKDFILQPEDILFVPNSYARSTLRRTLDTAVQMATGVVIYRGW
jgi:polysaccharide biosynthesis/export protein